MADERIDVTKQPWAFHKDRNPRFRVGKLLAGGSYGAVYQAELDGCQIVAKTLHAFVHPDEFGLDSDDTFSFWLNTMYTELDVLTRIEPHPHIVGFRGLAYGHFKGHVVPTYILMELVGGRMRYKDFWRCVAPPPPAGGGSKKQIPKCPKIGYHPPLPADGVKRGALTEEKIIGSHNFFLVADGSGRR